MLKRSLKLLNLDTGETYLLGRVIMTDAADLAPPGEPDPKVYTLASLWHDQMAEQLREDPASIEGTLRSLSAFLVANRGQPLTIVEYEHADELAGEVTDALGLDAPRMFFGGVSQRAQSLVDFARRRWDDLVHPRLPHPNQALNRSTRVTTEVAERIKKLVRRKLGSERAEVLSDVRPGDYPGFETFEKYGKGS